MTRARKILVCVATLLIASSAVLWLVAQGPVHIVIMHTNDIHGQLLPKNGVGGMAEMAGIIRSAQPDIVLDAGDLFTGTLVSDETKGVPTIQAMNAIRYTAGTIGNHEFDYGQDALRMRLREANFPILSANLDTPIAEIKKYTVVTAKGIRFGIIGVTTEELKTSTHPKNLNGVEVRDVVKSIEQLLPELRRTSDFIIVTAHLMDVEEQRIAMAFPEIRLIVGGHNHSALGPIRAGNTLIAKTGNVGRNVGRVDLDFNGKTLTRIEGRLIPVRNAPPDPEITRIIAPFESRVAAQLRVVVGEASGNLNSSRDSESALANLVADAIRERGRTQIGFQNLGGIRATIARGPITWGSVFEVLPFQNTLVTLKLTGAQLKRTLNLGLFAVSGLRLRLDLRKPAGQRLISVTLTDGSPIQDATLYSITTNDFIVAGGDGLTEFGKGRDTVDTGILLRDAMADYLKTHRPVSPALDGRIRTD